MESNMFFNEATYSSLHQTEDNSSGSVKGEDKSRINEKSSQVINQDPAKIKIEYVDVDKLKTEKDVDDDVNLKEAQYESHKSVEPVPNLGNGDASSASRDSPDMTVQETSTSAYGTDHEGHLDRESLSVYSCHICLFQGQNEQDLRNHMTGHKTRTFKCELCTYEAKYKYIIRRHMAVHNKSSEVIMYKCETCSYQTKHKNMLRIHMFVHRAPSEIPVYKCKICSYEAIRKKNLTAHMLVHKNPSEVKMHQCKICLFESKYKSNLKIHMKKHLGTCEINDV